MNYVDNIAIQMPKLFVLIFLFHTCSSEQKRHSEDLPPELISRLRQSEKIEGIYTPTKSIQLSTTDTLLVGDIVYLYITKDRRIAILDRANRTPLLFDSTGYLITQIGKYGSGPAEFKGASAICFDESSKLWYVSDNAHRRVTVFSNSGEYLKAFEITASVKALRIAQNGDLYLFMPNKRNGGMVERVNSQGKKIATFLISKMVQKLRFSILGGGLHLAANGVFATHYISSDLSYFDYNGNEKWRYDLRNLNGFIAAPDPAKVRNPTDYISSFTGVTNIFNGPLDMTLVQYGRAVITTSKSRNRGKGEKHIAFLTESGEVLANGVISSTAFKASDSDGNLYSVEYPSANSIDNVKNPVVTRWTLKSF